MSWLHKLDSSVVYFLTRCHAMALCIQVYTLDLNGNVIYNMNVCNSSFLQASLVPSPEREMSICREIANWNPIRSTLVLACFRLLSFLISIVCIKYYVYIKQACFGDAQMQSRSHPLSCAQTVDTYIEIGHHYVHVHSAHV